MPAASDVVVAYVVCADMIEARRIGRALVEERLAACVNLRPHEAIYRWQDTIETAGEVAMLAKTTADAFDRLRDRVRQMHGYQVPCILALPVVAADRDYLAWLKDQL